MSPMDGSANYYCLIPRDIAKDEYQAADYLSTAFKFIPKIKGTSMNKQKAQIFTSGLVVIINEELF